MNSNQYSSLPHTNTNIGGVQRGTTFYQNNTGAPNNGLTNNNRNYKNKKNNSKRNNFNNSPAQQISNNYNSHHLDFGCASLPHTQVSNNGYNNTNNNNNNRYGNQFQQFNKFTTNAADLNSFGNNVPVPKPQKKNNRRRRGGSNNNYNGNSNFQETITERLNKSFKEMSGDNSFNEMSTNMPTSFSLDNIGGCINFKNPTKMSNSHSFQTKSPSKLHKLTEADVIQEVTENFGSINIDSGVDSNSYCSMPATDSHKSYVPLTSDLLSSIECDESSSKNSSPISSPDSQKNGYETALSQMVTASEGELSFGYESTNHIAENTISNFTIEASFTNSIDHAVLESYLQRVSEEELRAKRCSEYSNIKTCQELESSFESSENSLLTPKKTANNSNKKKNVSSDEEKVSEYSDLSEESEKIEEAVVESEAIVEAVVESEAIVETVVESEAIVETVVEPEAIVETVVEPEAIVETVVEPEAIVETVVEPKAIVESENTIKSPIPEIIITMTPDCVKDTEEEDFEKTPVLCVDEEVSTVSVKLDEIELDDVVEEIENKSIQNLISQSPVEAEEQMSEEMLNSLKFAEQEVNDLVNKIVVDVISQAIKVPEQTLEREPVISDYDSKNFMSLEQEINKLNEEKNCDVDIKTSNIDNNEISYIDNEGTDENSSMEIIEKPEKNNTEEQQTEAILSKTNKVLSKSSSSFKLEEMTTRKEPPVDCFSCTIS